MILGEVTIRLCRRRQRVGRREKGGQEKPAGNGNVYYGMYMNFIIIT